MAQWATVANKSRVYFTLAERHLKICAKEYPPSSQGLTDACIELAKCVAVVFFRQKIRLAHAHPRLFE